MMFAAQNDVACGKRCLLRKTMLPAANGAIPQSASLTAPFTQGSLGGVRRNDVCCANDVGCAQRPFSEGAVSEADWGSVFLGMGHSLRLFEPPPSKREARGDEVAFGKRCDASHQ